MFPLELLTFIVDTVRIIMRQGLCNHKGSPGARRVCCCGNGEREITQKRAGGRLAVVAPHEHGPQCHVYSRLRRLNTDLFACVWIITIASRGQKVKVTGQVSLTTIVTDGSLSSISGRAKETTGKANRLTCTKN